MKTLLIPALAFTLAGLSAQAQKSSPGAPTVPTTVERSVAPSGAQPGSPASSVPPKISASTPAPALLRRVKFDGEPLSEVIAYLNTMLAEQSADPVNVVVSAGLEATKVPSVFLQNVTATDVMNVIAKITDLRVEPVPSDSGKVAAWIITKAKPVARKSSAQLFGGGGGAEMEGVGDALIFGQTVNAPATPVPSSPGAMPGSGGGLGGGLAGVSSSASPNATWIDPAGPVAAPADTSRVLGIGKLFDEIPDDEERAKKEQRLADTLQRLGEEQRLACTVRPYHELHVIIVKGTPEAVALVEQTITAMKENVGVKKPATLTAPRGF